MSSASNSASPAEAWTDNPVSLASAQARDKDKLYDAYYLRGLSYCLRRVRPFQQVEEYVISSRPNRFFFWFPLKAELRYIRTPWSLDGLRVALNSGQSLETQLVRKWSHEPPSVQDMIPCPDAPSPKWLTDPENVLCDHQDRDFRFYDLHCRRPILFYNGSSGDEDADFFYSEGNYYLYFPFHDVLYGLPDIRDAHDFHKLGDAPKYEILQLIEIGPGEILGGRRMLDQAALPPGWTQLPWAEEHEISVLPARCRHLYKTVVLTSVDGNTRIVEVGYEYFMWLVTKDVAFKIDAPGGLEEILAALRSNSDLNIVED